MESILFSNGEPIQQEEWAALGPRATGRRFDALCGGRLKTRLGGAKLRLGRAGECAPISARPVSTMAPLRISTVHLISCQIRLGRMDTFDMITL